MNSLVITNWYAFHQNADVVKNAMLLADEVTLVFPPLRREGDLVVIDAVNNKDESLANDSLDNLLKLYSEGFLKCENWMFMGYEKENNYKLFHKINNDLDNSYILGVDYYTFMKIVNEKEAIFLNLDNTDSISKDISEQVNFTKANLLKHCQVNLPNIERLSFDEIVLLKKKYEDEIMEAQIYINSLSFEISNLIKLEPFEQQNKYIQMYVKELINPRVKRMIKMIKQNRDNKLLAIARKIVKVVPVFFTASNSLEIVSDLFKTSIDVSEEFKKEHGTEKAAFLSIMVKSYKQ